MTEIKEIISTELEKINSDINMLARYIKTIEAKFEDTILEQDEDLKSLEQDIVKKLNELIENKTQNSGDVVYIQNLIKDDFREMQTTLIQQVTEIINKIQGFKK